MHFPGLFIKIFLVAVKHMQHSKNVNKIYSDEDRSDFFFLLSFRLIIFKEFPRQNDRAIIPTHFSIYVNSLKFVFLSRIISLFHRIEPYRTLSMYKQPTLLVFFSLIYFTLHIITERAHFP